MSEEIAERERRRYLRVAVDEGLECDITDVGVVHIVGISADGRGMRIITNKELPADQEMDLALSRDGLIIFKGQAKAVWREAWDFEFCSRHVSGVELVGLSDEDRSILVGKIPVMREPGLMPEEML